MTKSKSFWLVAALLSLAVAAFSGYAVYGRLALHFSGDTVELKSSPVPPPGSETQPDSQEPDEKAEKTAEAAEPQKTPEAEKSKAVKTAFEYKDAKAKSVSIAGSFTSWKDAKMTKKDGAWRKDVYILPGTYPYHFTVDGKKKTDAGKPTSPTGDSLITVQ